MRAIVYTESGGPEVLHLVERDTPEPGPGEVRVRIAVSGVNPTDWKSRAGTAPDGEQVPGQDGAGIVDAVGDGTTFSVGDRVWVWDAAWQRPNGTSQESVVLPASHVQPLPDAASFDLGASLGIPALTAHLALRAGEPASPLAAGALAGRTVLVAGGAGAVGHAAIELARWAGATVIATVSSDAKRALALAAGADEVIDYRAEDAGARLKEFAPNGVDRIVEVNPVANAELDADAIATGGVIAAYATTGPEPLELALRPLMTKNAYWHFLLTYTALEDHKSAAVAGVQAALEAGVLRVGDDAGMPLTRFPLTETAAAHRAVEDGAVGKVLIDVA